VRIFRINSSLFENISMKITHLKPNTKILMIASLMLEPLGLEAVDTKTTSHNLDNALSQSDDASHSHITVASNTISSYKTTSHNTSAEQEADYEKKQDHYHAIDSLAPTPGDIAWQASVLINITEYETSSSFY